MSYFLWVIGVFPTAVWTWFQVSRGRNETLYIHHTLWAEFKVVFMDRMPGAFVDDDLDDAVSVSLTGGGTWSFQEELRGKPESEEAE
jgi:hypothetical protein